MFKVLVPPGMFRLSFATGDVWYGEENLFGAGADTQAFELNKPLTFKIRSLSIKAGHLLRILELKPGQTVQAAVKDQLICQSLRAEFPSPTYLSLEENVARNAGRRGWTKTGDGQLKYLEGGLFDQTLNPKYPEYYLPVPRYVKWSQFCG